MVSNSNPRSYSDYSVGWISAVQVELTSARAALDEVHPSLSRIPGDSNNYILGRIGPHNVAIACLPPGAYGIGSAATAATEMRRSFPNLTTRLLVGIGGGIPGVEDDVRLGDVVVSVPKGGSFGVVQYDLGKTEVGKRWINRSGVLSSPPRSLLNAVGSLNSAYEIGEKSHALQLQTILENHSRLKPRYEHPGSENDRLFAASYSHAVGEASCANCDSTQAEVRARRHSEDPQIHTGTIASGNSVVKDPETRSHLRDDCGAICVEMEAAGLMNGFECLVIRGVCDYADSHKNNMWQPYAALSAAAYAKDFLLTIEAEQQQVRRDEASTSVGDVSDHSLQPLYLFPNTHVPQFFGRKALLENVSSVIRAGSEAEGQSLVVVLQAMGGQGKTQLALRLCHTLKRVLFRSVLWIDASSKDTVEAGFIRVSTELNKRFGKYLDSIDSRVRFVIETLESAEERWMFIFDNHDSYDKTMDIRDYFPQNQSGVIMITTRREEYGYLGNYFQIPSMTGDDGEELILSRYHSTKDEKAYTDATKIVQRLGGLALAIAQASAYISFRRIELASFVEEYDKNRPQILRYAREDLWEYHQERHHTREETETAWTTWEMSVQCIDAENDKRTQQILDFLSVSAFLDPFQIDEDLFKRCQKRGGPLAKRKPTWLELFVDQIHTARGKEEARRSLNINDVQSEDMSKNSSDPLAIDSKMSTAHVWNSQYFWEVIQKLYNLALVQEITPSDGSDGAHFALHPVIRDWLLLRGGPGRTSEIAKQSLRFLAAAVDGAYNGLRNALLKQRWFSHIKSYISNCAVLRINDGLGSLEYWRETLSFSDYMTSIRQAHEVVQWLENLREGEDGRSLDDSALAEICYPLGRWYTQHYYYEKAEAIYSQAMEIQLQEKGDHDAGTLISMLGLADVRLADARLGAGRSKGSGRFKEAESMYLNVLEICKNVSSEFHEIRLAATVGLARIYYVQNRLKDAERLYVIVVEKGKQQLGEKHRFTLDSMHELVRTYLAQGRYKEAEKLGLKHLEKTMVVLGQDHYHTLKSMSQLAGMYYTQHRYEEAKAIDVEVYEKMTRTAGKDHPRTLATMRRLARTLNKMGRTDEACSLLTQCLDISVKVLGPDHENTHRFQELLDSFSTREAPALSSNSIVADLNIERQSDATLELSGSPERRRKRIRLGNNIRP